MAVDGDNVRAYVPLRKRHKNADTQRERNDVLPYNAAVDGTASEAGSNIDDVLQEAEWTRLEHGISVVTDAASVTDTAVGSNNAASGDRYDTPPAVETFEQMHLPSGVLRALHARGITRPTAIQMQAIPSVLSGRDVIGLASTGSGKTLCFLLPLLALLARQPCASMSHSRYAAAAPLGLVIVPTRELMEQIFHELSHFATSTPSPAGNSSDEPQWLLHGDTFTALGVCGGIPLQYHVMQIQQQQQQQGSSGGAPINIVVATPGRLLHLLARRCVSLQQLQYLVLDEVDRMLDAEMEPQLRQILHASNAVARQTLLWSATMPHFLARLARSAVLDPITIRVGMGRDHAGRTPLTVTQHVLVVRGSGEKRARLLQALRSTAAPPVLVFCNSHASVDAVARVLQSEQFHAAALHGDKPQTYRFQVVAAFRAGYVDVLVATDVAARGLDFADVAHVVIYDMPHTIEDYVHRCGRTGRRGTSGRVTALVTTECTIAKELKQLLVETRQVVPRELDVSSRFHQPPAATAWSS